MRKGAGYELFEHQWRENKYRRARRAFKTIRSSELKVVRAESSNDRGEEFKRVEIKEGVGSGDQ